jgi:two-component system sensor histidine kinase RpfC
MKLFRLGNPDRADMPFIMLTANATTDALEASRQAGFEAYLTKPLDAERLIATVARVTQRSGEPQRGPSARGADAPAQPHVDHDKLAALARLDAGGGFLHELLSEFGRDGERLLAAMHEDLETSRWAAFAEHAHELKGAARTVGAVEMARRVEHLDAPQGRRSPADLRASLAAIGDAFRRTRAEFGSYLRRKAD